LSNNSGKFEILDVDQNVTSEGDFINHLGAISAFFGISEH